MNTSFKIFSFLLLFTINASVTGRAAAQEVPEVDPEPSIQKGYLLACCKLYYANSLLLHLSAFFDESGGTAARFFSARSILYLKKVSRIKSYTIKISFIHDIKKHEFATRIIPCFIGSPTFDGSDFLPYKSAIGTTYIKANCQEQFCRSIF
jgi:hypothetical protein